MGTEDRQIEHFWKVEDTGYVPVAQNGTDFWTLTTSGARRSRHGHGCGRRDTRVDQNAGVTAARSSVTDEDRRGGIRLRRRTGERVGRQRSDRYRT